MRDVGVGRVLLASLHQGIADVLPTRLGFYESWLHAKGLRDGTIDLAPLYAVLSFLRQEGEAYERITTSAGEYAAEWTVQSMGALERSVVGAAPNWLRRRLILRLADRLVRASYRNSRLRFAVRRGVATLDLQASVFCDVRDRVDAPLCGFYRAAVLLLCALFGVVGTIEIASCRATGATACAMTLRFD